MKKNNLFLIAAFSMCLTFNVQASVSSELMDYVRLSLTSASERASQGIQEASAKYADLISSKLGERVNQADTLTLIKKPLIKPQGFAPGMIMRRGLYSKYNNPSSTLWIGLVLTKEAAERLPAKFDELISSIVKENPTFNIEFTTYFKKYGLSDKYEVTGNVNRGALEVMIGNSEGVMISGQKMVIINIPVSTADNVEDVLELINAIDSRLVL